MATASTNNPSPEAAELIRVERQGDTVILSPRTDLCELLCQEISAEASRIYDYLTDPSIRHVIVDFAGTDFFGSSALGMLLHLRKLTEHRQGHMVLCNVSEHEQEILRVTHLEPLWTIYPTRADAERAISGK